MTSRSPQRHDLVFVDPKFFGGTPMDRELAAWAGAGFPFVQRMQPGQAVACQLGWPRPLGAPQRRFGFSVPFDAVVWRSRPPRLRDVAAAAPDGWTQALRRAFTLEQAFNLRIGVYGSLAWQGLTGLRYVHANSDLDLLVEGLDGLAPGDRQAAISRLIAGATPRVDGEAVLADRAAISLREFLKESSQVLVRHLQGPRLEPHPLGGIA